MFCEEAFGLYLNSVANEWLGCLNDHSKILKEKILLKIQKM